MTARYQLDAYCVPFEPDPANPLPSPVVRPITVVSQSEHLARRFALAVVHQQKMAARKLVVVNVEK
jgi:hypothetical protein